MGRACVFVSIFMGFYSTIQHSIENVHVQVPGLSAPIPPGASFGFQPGGWGKAPVDENGDPLYGDVFGQNAGDDDDELVRPFLVLSSVPVSNGGRVLLLVWVLLLSTLACSVGQCADVGNWVLLHSAVCMLLLQSGSWHQWCLLACAWLQVKVCLGVEGWDVELSVPI